jgi:hypothetical protein
MLQVSSVVNIIFSSCKSKPEYTPEGRDRIVCFDFTSILCGNDDSTVAVFDVLNGGIQQQARVIWLQKLLGFFEEDILESSLINYEVVSI